jgi:rhodanese-related sulfurtransferase
MAMIKHIDTAELCRLQESGRVVLVDVRTDAEVARGYLAGAYHIPLHMLPARHSELEPGAPTVIYCQSGGRSAQACAWLEERGFAEVLNLQGGMGVWLREGRPVVVPG